MQQGNQQFIVHVKSEYDYMFESNSRDEIFKALKYIFHQTKGINLPVFGVHDKLKDYATSKKDISNGIDVIPKNNFRIKEEDIYIENTDVNLTR